MKKSFLLFLGVFVVLTVFLTKNVFAAAGINRKINFQGKVVKTDGTNVADNNYNFQFSLWTTPTVGTSLWSEVWNTGNQQIGVSSGIFSVDLGTNTTFPPSIDFNSDTLYLSIGFSGEADMSPRIRMTAVPYAFNAEKVGGLTVTNTTGTLTIPNGKTISFADGFTTVGVGITLDQSLATTNSVTFAGLSIGGSVAFTNTPVSVGTTLLYIDATGKITKGLNNAVGTTYSAGVGLTLSNTNVFSLNLGNTNVWLAPQYFANGIGVTGNTTLQGNLTVGGTFVSVGSTNLVTNLNAQYLNGHSDTYFLDFGDTGPFIQTLNNGVGISISGSGISRTIAVDYNSTNLKITGNQLDTIQGISVNAQPTFARLGIGSTNSLYLLNVGGTANFTNLFTSGNVGIGTSSPSQLFQVGTGSSAFTVTSAGYVGIGTSNPSARLEIANSTSTITNVTGDITISAASGTVSLNGGFLTDITQITIGSGTSSAPAYAFSSDTDTGMYSGGTNILKLATAGTDRVIITALGNVGIGATNPSEALEVNGDIYVNHLDNTDSTIYFSGDQAYIRSSGDTFKFKLGSGGDGYHFFSSTGEDIMNLTESAYLGIGTSNPLGPLQVAIGNTQALFVNASGNVGIGTTTFGGDGGVTPRLEVANPSSSDKYVGIGYDNTGDYGFIHSVYRANSWKNLVLQGFGGNVGIGTTSPVSKFSVTGSSRFNGSLLNESGFNGMGDQESMVPNSGFEINDDATTTIADGWTLFSNTTGSTLSVTTDSYQGARAQTLYGTASTEMSIISSCFPVTTGSTYSAYIWAKANTASGDGFYIRMYGYSDGACQSYVGISDPVANSNVATSWTKYGGTATATSMKSAKIIIYQATPNNTSTITFDSLRLTPAALTNTIDLAENYFTTDNLLPGQLVKTDTGFISGVTSSSKDNDQALIGIVSSNPAITLGEGITGPDGTHTVKVALSGRVPAIVSTANGAIKSGDYITSTSKYSGIGAKSINYGRVVGMALESSTNWNISACSPITDPADINWPSDNGSDSQLRPCFTLPDGTIIGKLMTFVNPTWYDPESVLTDNSFVFNNVSVSKTALDVIGYSGTKNEIENATYSVADATGRVISKIGQFGELVGTKIMAGLITTKNLIADNIAVKHLASENVVTDNLTTTNATISGKLMSQSVGASEASFSTVYTDLIITPEGNLIDSIISKIKNLNEGAIDASESATLLSQLNFANIQFNYQTKLDGVKYAVAQLQTETISPLIDSEGNPVEIKIDGNVKIKGVLTVDSIITNSIEGLDVSIQIAGLNEKYNELKSEILGVNSSLALMSVIPTGIVSPTPTPEPTNILTKVLAEFWNKVLFKGQTEFEKNPLFNKDMAGLAILNAGETGVEVKFENSFEQTPIVNISLMADSEEESQALAENYIYYIANRSQDGFFIKLNKAAKNNIRFSWTALLIKDVKTFQNQLTPTPTQTITPELGPSVTPPELPTPLPTLVPTLEATPSGVVVQ